MRHVTWQLYTRPAWIYAAEKSQALVDDWSAIVGDKIAFLAKYILCSPVRIGLIQLAILLFFAIS